MGCTANCTTGRSYGAKYYNIISFLQTVRSTGALNSPVRDDLFVEKNKYKNRSPVGAT